MPVALPTTRSRPISRRPLLHLAVAAVLGIVLDSMSGGWLVENGLWLWWCLASGCLFTVGLSFVRWGRWTHGGRWPPLLLLLATFCLAGSWHHFRWHYYEQNHLARFANEVPQPVCLQAVAIDRLKWRPAPPSNPLRALPVGPGSEIKVRVTRVRDGRDWVETTGICKLRINGELHNVMAGDELQVFALMGTLTPALNPGEYDWAESERGAGRHSELYGAVLRLCC